MACRCSVMFMPVMGGRGAVGLAIGVRGHRGWSSRFRQEFDGH